MKKIIKALAIPAALFSTSMFAADCDDFSGTYAGNCVNYPPEFTQVRSIVDQNGCGNVQVILDIILTELNEEKYPGVPVGTTLILRALDMHPGDNLNDHTETFVRNEFTDDNIPMTTTNSRSSTWNNEGTGLIVEENTVVEIGGQVVYDGDLLGTFFLDANDNTINLDLTEESEMDPLSSGDCKFFKLP